MVCLVPDTRIETRGDDEEVVIRSLAFLVQVFGAALQMQFSTFSRVGMSFFSFRAAKAR
jgi:hypothetical protein